MGLCLLCQCFYVQHIAVQIRVLQGFLSRYPLVWVVSAQAGHQINGLR